ncbi:zinc finger protein [Teratosphaeria destructans]|uniref:Zinc finger protein n=1 Tax=Teratosphaeria destructans TaxID=418781 RepID=A0A9W7T030_9PEZI|nr:zinc finger protein [Teratosphaeria destructans]
MSRTYTTTSPQTQKNDDASIGAILQTHLQRDSAQSMDGRQPDYPQSGLSSPYAPYNGHQSESSSADQASAVQYQPGQDYKPSTFSSSATPSSEYGLPQSARSGSFPEYIQRSYQDGQQSRYPASAQGGHAAMAQTSSPSISTPEGQQGNGHASNLNNSNGDVPIDPSIAQSSPSYPPAHNYSPYPPQHEMPQYANQPMTYGRPEWAGHYQQPMGYGHSPATTGGAAPGMPAHVPKPPAVGAPTGYPGYAYPNATQGGHPLSTVYSFVPIPGAQQHKRPRRRYEEIERMYKCGWNGCEKAYGTLNHLNAHVTMQSHGAKRTPEEFKEIRKEWKAKKKEEENSRKQEEERQRQEAARNGDSSQAPGQPVQYGQQHMMPPQMGGPQLPPIGYQPAGGQPGQYAQQQQQVDGAQQYGGSSQMYGAQGYPQSPYAQNGVQYQQRAP